MNFRQLAIAALVVVGTAGVAFAGGKAPYKASAIEDAKYGPMDPKMPEGPQVAVIDGNPQKGPSQILLKLKPGSAPIHMHSADYTAVVVQGTTKHWQDGKDADAKPMKVGSWWHQPGKEFHGDTCVGPEECVVYISFAGPIDMKAKPETKDAAMKEPAKDMAKDAAMKEPAKDAAKK